MTTRVISSTGKVQKKLRLFMPQAPGLPAGGLDPREVFLWK
jgi:hypothetical protein